MTVERGVSGLVDGEKGLASWLRGRPNFLALALVYVGYIAAGGFGHRLTLIPGVYITFWPPVGILIATMLMSPRHHWPWWIATGCLAELTCNAIWFHNPLPYALIYYSGNALESLAAAWLIRWWLPESFRFESLEEVAAFIVLAVGIAPTISATVIAVTDSLLGKHLFSTAWTLVWLGDRGGLEDAGVGDGD